VAGACSAIYQTTSAWQGGFQGQVTVKAGSAAIAGWTVTWPLASGQSITQIWGGELTSTGSPATVRNVSWNGALTAGATASFGFLANGAATTPTLTCTPR
jgi:endoglucanase